MTTASLQQALADGFGLSEFRKGQKEILQSVFSGQDVLAVLPTGGGKSLCFQFPAYWKQQLVIVVSPLIALMKDQVAALRRRGLRAGALYSGQTDVEKRAVFSEMSEGGTFLLYLSPERVQKEGFRHWLAHQNVALFAVDEAHCVSQWGHDFRQEYAQLNLLKTLRPDVPVLALTASATPLVLSDIAKNLGLQKPARHVHGFYRPNLYYQVEYCADEDSKLRFLKQALRQTPRGRILVYCGTRKLTEEVAVRLSEDFSGVGRYHAGLSSNERTAVQETYSRGDSRILVATNAFGMGIDHPDVRLVVHFNMPANIDSLYQEMGRAGRDGSPSTCLLLYSPKDKGLQSFFIQSSEAPAHIKKSRWNTLNALVAYSEGGECRHSEILTYYQDSQRLSRCGHCDSCDPQSERRVLRPAWSEGASRNGKGTNSAAAQEGLVTTKVVRRPAAKKPKGGADVESLPLNPKEELRFQLLRDWRRQKSLELDVPAFVIFSDRTIRQLARQNPSSVEQLGDVHGFGEVKTERFGSEILRVLGNS